MLPKEKGTPQRPWRFRTAGTSNMPPVLPWLFRETPLDRNRLPMIWKSASRKILRQIYLCAGSSRLVGTGEREAHRQRGAAANHPPLRAGGERPQLRSFLSWRSALGLCARRGVDCRASVSGSGRRVSEDPRSSRDRRRGSDWRAGTPAIGRTFALSGDMVKAKLAYGDFFTLWKDADPDVPILVQAKAEYARLP